MDVPDLIFVVVGLGRTVVTLLVTLLDGDDDNGFDCTLTATSASGAGRVSAMSESSNDTDATVVVLGRALVVALTAAVGFLLPPPWFGLTVDAEDGFLVLPPFGLRVVVVTFGDGDEALVDVVLLTVDEGEDGFLVVTFETGGDFGVVTACGFCCGLDVVLLLLFVGLVTGLFVGFVVCCCFRVVVGFLVVGFLVVVVVLLLTFCDSTAVVDGLRVVEVVGLTFSFSFCSF